LASNILIIKFFHTSIVLYGVSKIASCYTLFAKEYSGMPRITRYRQGEKNGVIVCGNE